jgi:hypothetical protein
VLESEGHQGSDDGRATHADIPEANSLWLFITLIPARFLSACCSIGEETPGLTHHIDVIKINEGEMQDSNMPSRNLVATKDAYELQAEVQATTAPQQQTIVPRYFAVGNRCL